MEAVLVATVDAVNTTQSNIFKLAVGYQLVFFVNFNVIQLTYKCVNLSWYGSAHNFEENHLNIGPNNARCFRVF